MKNNSDNEKLLVALAVSLTLHLIVLFFVFVGLPFKSKPLPMDEIQVIELLPVSSVNNVKTQKVQKEPAVQNEDAKKIEKSKIEETPPPPTEEEKPMEKTPEKAPEPEPAPKKESEVALKEKTPEKPKEEKPKEEKKKEEKPKEPLKKKEEKKKEEKKPKKAPTDKELTSLLKNLEQASEGNNDKSNKRNREKSDATHDAFGNFDESLEESLTNDELIKQQIKKHWNVPVAAATEAITIRVHLQLLEDGTVEKYDILDVNCPPTHSVVCQAAQNSILRAIKLASPLVNLQVADYNSWKDITINFNTKSR